MPISAKIPGIFPANREIARPSPETGSPETASTAKQSGLLISDFHRDYLIEIIEHEAENELNPGTHPTLALGPGQRFASNGAFVVRLDPKAKGGYRPISDWIVP